MKSTPVIQEHLPAEQFEFVELVKQLESDLSGLFNGHVAGYIDQGRVCFVEEYEPEPDVESWLDERQLFLPFTSPDACGGMIYADGSPVSFEHDLEKEPFGECDCYGYLVSREDGEYLVESSLCTLNSTGPGCHHGFEANSEAPNSPELRGKMKEFVNRFVKTRPGAADQTRK